MNDRFKFRFFNEYSNKLESCDEYDLKDIFESGNPVMQCTGLKDKNGKLIYEGDIVKQNKAIYCVTWEKGSYGFCDIRTKITYTVEDVTSKKQEVIGNIYENKELLEG